jgi:hypothetical protein
MNLKEAVTKMRKKEDKPAALDHALYEIEMLVQNLIGNGRLEAFAIHARNLNEFFAKKDLGGAYMKPHHFVTTWTYSYVFDTDLARRASSQVAHLTYDRERPEEKTSWPVERYFKALREPSLAFLRAVVPVESLMAYHANKERTEALLGLLPRIRFEGDST